MQFDSVDWWLVDGLVYNLVYLFKIEILIEDFKILKFIKICWIVALLLYDYYEIDKWYLVFYLQDG